MMRAEPLWAKVVPLSDVPDELIKSFVCGEPALDNWLHESLKAVSCYACSVHVCIDSEGYPVAFFSLSSASAKAEGLSSDQRGGISDAIPATLLGKLGVRKDLQNKGYGTHVLNCAKYYALQATRISASRLLIVDALNENLVTWYCSRGFCKPPASDLRLVCKMSKIKKEIEGFSKEYTSWLSLGLNH